ncbi:MAG: hypothetical protein GF364_17160 [Candidatus Lokiarchaeota archaeon]|nr:hypothetical protein [Candidatus Lokiarchaeota archaeon]
MLQQLGWFFEALGTLAGIIAAVFVLRKNKRYIGNILMAISLILISSYIGAILIYDLALNAIVIQILYRIAISSLLVGTMLLYFTMQIMVHSSTWLDNKKKIIPWIIAVIGFIIWIIIDEVVDIVDIETANTQIRLMPLLVLVLFILVFLITSIVDLYLHGIRKIKRERKMHMIIFLTGLIICLISIGISIASQIVSDVETGQLLDVIFFAVLSLGMIVVAIGFSRNPKDN